MKYHFQRAQVLPIWIFSSMCVFTFAVFFINYAYLIGWQTRAQVAAQTAAQGALANQIEQYNNIQALLYASSIEERRLRHLIADITLIARRSGDCTTALTWDGACPEIYNRIYPAFQASFQRYTDDVVLMGHVTAEKFPQKIANARNLITSINNGLSNNGIRLGDGAFKYTLLNYGPRDDIARAPYGVYQDALALIPGSMGNAASLGRLNIGNANAFWLPPEAEVLTCANVPPLINFSFLNFKIASPTMHVMARGAATAAPVTSEWITPSMVFVTDPTSPLYQYPLQIAESYDAPVSGLGNPYGAGGFASFTQGDGWYDITYDTYAEQNVSKSTANNSSSNLQIVGHTFIAAMNWWNAVPTAPYMGPIKPNYNGLCK